MSDPARDKSTPQQRSASAPAGASPPIELTRRPNPKHALSLMRAIIRGAQSENFSILAELATGLTTTERAEFLLSEMHSFAAVPGDVALDVSEALGATLPVAITTALASGQPVSAARLQRHLAPRLAIDLATLDDELVKRVRGTLKQPLLLTLPGVARDLAALERSLEFLRWLVETAPSPVVARLMSQFGTEAMAETLNAGGLWSWIGDLNPALINPRIEALAAKTNDPMVALRLGAMAAPRHNPRWEAHLQPGLEAEIAAKPTTVHQILAAIGREGGSSREVGDLAIRELQRLSATADDILAAAKELSSVDRKLTLRALLAGKGVTAQHLTTFLAQVPDALQLLADDSVRARVRRLGIGLLTLLAGEVKIGSHVEELLANDALARWFVDEAGPQDLLELIGGDPARAPKAVRYVAAKHPDWAWVWKLTSPSGSEKTMRVLALNCPHAKATQYIRDVLLGDVSPELYKDTKLDNTSHAIDGTVYGAEQGRFQDAMKDGSADDVMARLADLQDGDRVKLGRSPDFAVKVGAKVGVEHYPRAAYLLGLPFTQTIQGSPERSTLLLSYLATRPHHEELAALNDRAVVVRAHTHVEKDVLRVFPSLRQPAVLAKALEQHADLVRLLLTESDPSRVLELLTHSEVRAKVDPVLQVHPVWLARLPHYAHLSKPGRDGFDRLSRSAPKDGEVRAQLDEAKEPEVHRGGKELHDARERKTLQEAIGSLLDENASPTAMLALLEERKAELANLLSEPTAWVTIHSLAKRLDVPPDIACPWISRDALFGAPNALRWWLIHRDGSALLHSLYGSARGRTAVARELDTGTNGARDWLQHLPVGAALSDLEEHTLLELSKLIKSVEVLRELFRVMYSIPLPKEWDESRVRTTFDTVARLPSAHLQQQRVRKIAQIENPPDGLLGQWNKHEATLSMSPNLAPGAKEDLTHPPDQPGWFTPQDMQKMYGLDEQALADKVASGGVRQLSLAVPLYRAEEKRDDQFASTLLHEFGHSVDEILGEHTPPVYDFAGWRTYADFDVWATEMGGWERVTPGDREKIRLLLIDAKKSEVPPLALAPADHPIRAARYRDVAVVKTALSGTSFAYENRVEHRGRVYSLLAENRMFSLDAKAAMAAPSDYSLKTPSEYFAESYAEYYVRPADKGGMLPIAVKDWFAKHVDTMRFDPRRMKSR